MGEHWNSADLISCWMAGRARIPFYGPPAAWDENNDPIDLGKLAIPATASPFKMAYEQIAAHLDGGPLPDWVPVLG